MIIDVNIKTCPICNERIISSSFGSSCSTYLNPGHIENLGYTSHFFICLTYARVSINGRAFRLYKNGSLIELKTWKEIATFNSIDLAIKFIKKITELEIYS